MDKDTSPSNSANKPLNYVAYIIFTVPILAIFIFTILHSPFHIEILGHRSYRYSFINTVSSGILIPIIIFASSILALITAALFKYITKEKELFKNTTYYKTAGWFVFWWILFPLESTIALFIALAIISYLYLVESKKYIPQIISPIYFLLVYSIFVFHIANYTVYHFK